MAGSSVGTGTGAEQVGNGTGSAASELVTEEAKGPMMRLMEKANKRKRESDQARGWTKRASHCTAHVQLSIFRTAVNCTNKL